MEVVFIVKISPQESRERPSCKKLRNTYLSNKEGKSNGEAILTRSRQVGAYLRSSTMHVGLGSEGMSAGIGTKEGARAGIFK